MQVASTAVVKTPVRQNAGVSPIPSSTGNAATAFPPSPGTFRHPRLTEIVRRHSKTSLSTQKIQVVVVNILAVVATVVLREVLEKVLGTLLSSAKIPPEVFSASSVILLTRILFITNAALCLRPVIPYVARKDEIADIPLTPSQRTLLGLPPSGKSSASMDIASTGYITPPRYKRDGGINTTPSFSNNRLGSSTERRSASATYSASPFSKLGHPVSLPPSPQYGQNDPTRSYRRASGSPFNGLWSGSPSTQKTMANDLAQSTSKRPTMPETGFNASQNWRERAAFDISTTAPDTPSPAGPKRQQGINYKWMYDKGQRLSKSESVTF